MGQPVQLTFGGLDPAYCFVSYNKLGFDIVAKITATLSGNILNGFSIGPTPPVDHTLLWVRTDDTGAPGHPWKIEGFYLWDTSGIGGWSPQQDPIKILYADDQGVVNALSFVYAPDSPLPATLNPRFPLVKGLTVIGTAKVTNTLAVTVSVNGSGPTAAKKQTATGLADLAANEIVAGNEYMWVYNGSVWICINPTPVSAGIFVSTDGDTIALRVAAAAAYVVPHGTTAAKIGWYRWSMLCVSADGGFSTDDEVDIHSGILVVGSPPTDWDTPFSTFVDGTNIGCAVNNECVAPNTINLPKKDASSDFNIDYAKWNLRVRYQILP